MEFEMDNTPFYNKKASDYTLNDSLKQAAAAAVVTTVFTALAAAAIHGTKKGANKFWENRKAKKNEEKTEEK